MPETRFLPGDPLLAVPGRELGDVLLDPVPKPELALFDEDHDRRRRGHGLRDRSQVEDHISRHRPGLGDALGLAVGPPENGLPLPGDEEDRPRKILPDDRGADNLIEVGQVFRRHAHVLRLGRGQSLAERGRQSADNEKREHGQTQGFAHGFPLTWRRPSPAPLSRPGRPDGCASSPRISRSKPPQTGSSSSRWRADRTSP
jgi:hypothetical protein